MTSRVDSEVYQGAFGRGLTIMIAAVGAIALVYTTATDGIVEALRFAPWVGLVVVLCWAYFWRPRVEVTDASVTLVNVLRTISVPWPAIQDVDTKWALRLNTVYGRYSAWAAPAPGMKSSVTSRRLADTDDARVLGSPITPWRREGGATLRPGDLPDTASGDAAAIVRRRWSELSAAGHLASPALEHDRPAIRWHLDTLAVIVALVAGGVLAALL